MTQFKFKRHAASYKNAKGDKTTISNATMSDEKAVEFLATNPERIRLFSDYPSNWETLIVDGVKSETKAQKEKRLAKEAELVAAKTGNAEADKGKVPTKASLMKMSLRDLRAKYPFVKATSKKNFADKVLDSLKAEKTPEDLEAEATKEAELAAAATGNGKEETEAEKEARLWLKLKKKLKKRLSRKKENYYKGFALLLDR